MPSWWNRTERTALVPVVHRSVSLELSIPPALLGRGLSPPAGRMDSTGTALLDAPGSQGFTEPHQLLKALDEGCAEENQGTCSDADSLQEQSKIILSF